MSRFIRPYVQLSHLNHRFGQRCGWAPNCINASGSAGGAFSPDDIPTILQNLGSPLTYAASPLGNVPVLESSIGEVGTPRGQSCVALDGSNDYLTLGARLTPSVATNLTLCGWVFQASLTSTKSILTEYVSGKNCTVQLETTATGFGAYFHTDATNYIATNFNSIFANGVWYHIAVTLDGSTIKAYVNGSEVSGTPANAGAFTGISSTSTAPFRLGNFNTGAYFSGRMHDWRVYSNTKSDAEILAIANQHTTPQTVDRTNAIAIWPLQEESGTKCYDVSGNGNDLTATNVDTSPGAFRTTDSGVKFSYPNQFGYTNNAGVIIPADLSDISLDCEGDALGTPGPIWLPGVMEVPCVTGDGSNVYVDLRATIATAVPHGEIDLTIYFSATSLSGTQFLAGHGTAAAWSWIIVINASSKLTWWNSGAGERLVSAATLVVGTWYKARFVRTGSTGNWTISLYLNDVLDSIVSSITENPAMHSAAMRTCLLSAGLYRTVRSSAKISTSIFTQSGLTTTFPIQDGPGSSNTNRDVAWYDSAGSAGVISGAIVNGSVSNIWANRTNVVRDHCIENGGGIAANGAFVPGIPGSANDAAGNAKTLAVGKRGNPYSKLLRNYFSAPALVNIGCTSSDKEAPGYDVQSESVANTRFRRTAADGDDRDLSFSEAQTGETLANIEEWTS